jgi:hypothetical protein
MNNCIKILIFFLLFKIHFSQAQSFINTKTVCAISEASYIEFPSHLNQNINSCKTDLKENFSINKKIYLPNIGPTWELSIIQEDSLWYGFMVSFTTNAMLRLDFGNSPLNTPAVVNMGNISNVFSNPVGLDIKKSKDKYFAVVTNWTDENIVFFEFKNGVNQVPTLIETDIASLIPNPIDAGLYTINNRLIARAQSNAQGLLYVYDFENNFNDPNKIESSMSLPFNPNGDYIYETDTSIFFATNTISSQLRIDEFDKDFKIKKNSWQYLTGYNNSRNCVLIPTKNNALLFVTSLDNSLYSVEFDPKTGLFSNDRISILESNVSVGTPYGLAYTAFEDNDYIFTAGNNDTLYVLKNNNSCENQPKRFVEYTAFDTVSNTKIRLLDSLLIIPKPKADFTVIKNCNSEKSVFSDAANKDYSSFFDWEWKVDNVPIDSNKSEFFKNIPIAGNVNVEMKLSSSCGFADSISKTIKIIPSDDIQSNFIVPDSICTNNSKKFINQSVATEDSIVSRKWSLLDAANDTITTSSAIDFVYNFDKSESYLLKLENLGKSACKTDTTIAVKPLVGPKAEILFSNNCIYDSTTITESSKDTNISHYQWFVDSVLVSNSPTFKLENDTLFTKSISLSTSNLIGCKTSNSKQITISPLPKAAFDSSFYCLSNEKQVFNRSTISDFSVLNYQWYINDSLVSTEKNPNLVFDKLNSNQLKLLAKNGSDCKDSVIKVQSVLPIPKADFEFETACLNDIAKFTDKSTDLTASINSRKWTIEEAIFSGQNPNYVFTQAGKYPISLEVKNDKGCADIHLDTLTIENLPIADFNHSTACEGGITYFSDLSSAVNDSIVDWKWSFVGNGILKSGKEIEHIFLQSQNQLLKLSVETKKGCKNSIAKTITVNPKPKSEFSVLETIGEPPFAISPLNESLNSVDYYWSDDKRGTLSTEFDPTLIFADSGDYELKLVAFSEFGCSDTSSQLVLVRKKTNNLQMNDLIMSVLPDGITFLSAEIKNLNAYSEDQFDIKIDFGNQYQQEFYVEEEINANSTEFIRLPFSMDIKEFENLDYVCAYFEKDTVCIFNEKKFKIYGAYPNPAENEILLNFYTPEPQEVDIEIHDELGRHLFSKKIELSLKGKNSLVVDTQDFVSYVLIVNYKTESGNLIEKIQKMK